jgi:acylphosphatase
MRCVRVVVRGRVQGVGFRAWTEDQAIRLKLAGWVRNRRDGTVEAVLGGEDAAVADMIAALREGPRLAYVSSVEIEESNEAPGAGFTALPTE